MLRWESGANLLKTTPNWFEKKEVLFHVTKKRNHSTSPSASPPRLVNDSLTACEKVVRAFLQRSILVPQVPHGEMRRPVDMEVEWFESIPWYLFGVYF
jgi:hypothetical protein